MSKSSIEWTTETWNPVVGCSILTPGCIHCYAMGMAARIEAINAALVADGKPMASPQYAGTTKKVNGHAVWTGRLALAGDNILLQPLKRKKPTTYFVNSMGDLFHEDVPDEWIDKVFAVMALAPQHTFQVLTKRAKRMKEYFTGRDDGIPVLSDMCAYWIAHGLRPEIEPFHWPLPNVWLGVSTERQQEYEERKEDLRNTPAAVRFFSMEPLIGPIKVDYLGDWVIVGGESGPGSRPMHPDWARSLRDQCLAAGVPFFFKQWGAYTPIEANSSSPDKQFQTLLLNPDGKCISDADAGRSDFSVRARYMYRVGKKAAGRTLDGIEYSEMPEVVR